MAYVALAVRQYGEGRICIATDRVSGYNTGHGENPVNFWRGIFEWTGQRFQNETISVGVIENGDYGAFSSIKKLHQIIATKITLQDISIKNLSAFDILYFSGLTATVSDDVHTKIEEYVNNGGGIIVEVPDRGDENINILTSIENIYCLSSAKPLQSNALWTLNGLSSSIYNSTAKMSFMTTLESTAFSTNWNILMSNIPTSALTANVVSSSYTTNASIGSEFGLSFISAAQNGIALVNNGVLDTFDYLGSKIYSADRYERIYGVFVSNIIIAGSNFLKWNQISWWQQKDGNSEIYLFIRASSSENDLESATWSKLLIDSPTDISAFTGQYLQFMIVMRCDSTDFSIPSVNRVNISYFTSENAVRFFTRAFHLGFKPLHILLTYNGQKVDDSVIRFAISGEDSADLTKYQYISPNKIEKLSSLSKTSEYIKIMLELVSTSDVETVVHEFSLMFSGDNVSRVNKIAMESSSTSSSSSSSTSSSSSSSSIDSSSSSSVGFSSSSSSEEYSSTSSSSSFIYSSSSSSM